MGKLSRRQFLLGGLVAGMTATALHEIAHIREIRRQQAIATDLFLQSPEYLEQSLQTALTGDSLMVEEAEAIQASVQLTPPRSPYEREISKLLIQCCRLGTEQYLYGKFQPDYDGAIASLPGYINSLSSYQQLASIQGPDHAEVRQRVEIPSTTTLFLNEELQENVDFVTEEIRAIAGQVITVEWQIPVFWGFVLSSPTANIIAFRGTQQQIEWLQNFQAKQIPHDDSMPFDFSGNLHAGFAAIYKNLSAATIAAAQQLDPSVPCYITGHSLGASVAALAALDIAQKLPQLKEQVRLYTYGAPRMGDRAFATAHSQLVPNSYRIANLSDAFTLLPPTSLNQTVYVHMGQPWVFSSQQGDIGTNHFVSTYRRAIEQSEERQG
ncbi:MAG: hypothetical protein ACFB8W_13655 [Elainellaceae cyanobacterium]